MLLMSMSKAKYKIPVLKKKQKNFLIIYKADVKDLRRPSHNKRRITPSVHESSRGAAETQTSPPGAITAPGFCVNVCAEGDEQRE